MPPSAPAGLSHFEGVTLPALREASRDGHQPAAVLRSPDGVRRRVSWLGIVAGGID